MTVTLTWAISLLLNNQEALKRVQEELDIHVGNKRLVDESDINKLEYLQAVIKETLRLYPAGPLSGAREVSQDCTIGGYDVAAGTHLITNIWKIQRDPRVWSEPSKFKPERFLSGHNYNHMDVKGQHFELSPFGYGRRACPGPGISLLMTQLVLARLIHSFELRTRCDELVDMTADLGPPHPISHGRLQVTWKWVLWGQHYRFQLCHKPSKLLRIAIIFCNLCTNPDGNQGFPVQEREKPFWVYLKILEFIGP